MRGGIGCYAGHAVCASQNGVSVETIPGHRCADPCPGVLPVPAEEPRSGLAELKDLKAHTAAACDQATAVPTKKYTDALQALIRELKLHRDFREALVVQQELNLISPPTNAAPTLAEGSSPMAPPPALQRLRRNYQTEVQAATKPLLTKYQASLEALLQRLMQAGDLAGIDAVQQEIKAVKSGVSSISANVAGYVETVWSWGTQEKITFWRDGKALLNTTPMRYQPIDATRIRVLYSDGGVWKDAYVIKFDFAKGTFAATHVAGSVINGKFLSRAPPADERR